MSRTRAAKLDPRRFGSVDRNVIQALPRELGIHRVIDQAAKWVESPDAVTKRAGLNLLGVLALDHPAAFAPLLVAIPIAVADPRVTVRRALARALSGHADQRVRPGLAQLTSDDDASVRVLAAAGLPLTCVDDEAGQREVAALLQQMLDDPDDEVRDWATFALGVQVDIDTPEVREALARKLTDGRQNTAGEATVALARRRDPRTAAVLLNALKDPNVGNLYVEAAAYLADKRLLPLLVELKAQDWQSTNEPRPHLLDEAIAACRTGVPRRN
ncbi:MAG: hypothetical protein QOD07_1438 [Frankiaceae bacterium]|jgi:HEAT repeat protein|nr:hypothetical protein [Frankiaceae bacterium]